MSPSRRRRGEPVLLIQGLGADSRGWLAQRRAIGRRYRGIVFDNRGVGRSAKPAGSYDLEQMANVHFLGAPGPKSGSDVRNTEPSKLGPVRVSEEAKGAVKRFP